jgi:tRNA1Val (adenine37-N6)-methyltransferase
MSVRQKHLFRFKQFDIYQEKSAMKVGTDGVLLGAWVDLKRAGSILDIGTGTGVIAIMAAQRNKEARITALEIDADSAIQAKENVLKCPWSDRIRVLQTSLQEYTVANPGTKYDLIVSNPPFFSGNMFSLNTRKAEGRHDISLKHEELLKNAKLLMHENSTFSVILPVAEGEEFINQAIELSIWPTRITEVVPKIEKPVERWLIELRFKPSQQTAKDTVVIQHQERNDWTIQYRSIVKDFYLNI